MRKLSVAEQQYQAALAVISDGLISQVASKVGVSRQTLHSWLGSLWGRESRRAGRPIAPPLICPRQISTAVDASGSELRRRPLVGAAAACVRFVLAQDVAAELWLKPPLAAPPTRYESIRPCAPAHRPKALNRASRINLHRHQPLTDPDQLAVAPVRIAARQMDVSEARCARLVVPVPPLSAYNSVEAADRGPLGPGIEAYMTLSIR